MRLHRNPITSTLIVPKDATDITSSRIGTRENLMDLNKTAAEVLSLSNGSITGNEIVARLCRQYREPEEKWRPKIKTFLQHVHDLGLLEFSNVPVWDGPSIVTTGNFSYPTPVHVTVELLSKCNLKCKHCYYNASPTANAMMPYDRSVQLFELLRQQGVYGIELTGGEVLIHPDFKRIFTRAVETFDVVAILTNGTHLSEEMVDMIAAHKERVLVSVSLDGPVPEIHDNFRGSKGAFDRTCRGIQRLSDRGVVVRVSMSVFEDNKWLIEDTLLLARQLGARWFNYEKVEPFGRGRHLDISFTPEEQMRFMEYEKNLHTQYADFIGIMTAEQMARYNKEHNCGAGWRSVAINPYGIVRPCVLTPQGLMDLGNIFTQSYEEIFNNHLVLNLMKLYAPVKNENCHPQCKNRYFCKGCFLRGLKSNLQLAPRVCRWVKENKLEEYVKKLDELETISEA